MVLGNFVHLEGLLDSKLVGFRTVALSAHIFHKAHKPCSENTTICFFGGEGANLMSQIVLLVKLFLLQVGPTTRTGNFN